MNSIKNRQIFVLVLVLLILLAACSRAADSNEVEPVATVDTSKIADVVLAEIEARLAGQLGGQNENQAADLPPVDSDAIAESVLAEVEARLAQEDEPAPTASPLAAADMNIGDLQEALVSLYQQANPAVVFILVPPLGSGSGFVLNNQGFIVTNNHVVDGGREYEVVFASGERRDADLIGRDEDSDLAVIQVNQLPAGVTPLSLGSSDELSVGQFVVAIGNPFGEQGSMSLGIVSGLGRSLQSQRELSGGSSYSLPEVVQTDAPINPGNSGGPLLNLDGEVVGVNSAIRTVTGTNSGVGFAIPVDAVSRIVPSLIDGGAYDYPFLGAAFDSEISLDEQAVYDLPQTQGAYVLNVTEDGPADQAGLVSANESNGRGGDLIIEIDKQQINDFGDLNSYLVFNTTVGQTIEITVLRSGERVDLPLTLGSRP
jgi:2-alkenal reductase